MHVLIKALFTERWNISIHYHSVATNNRDHKLSVDHQTRVDSIVTMKMVIIAAIYHTV